MKVKTALPGSSLKSVYDFNLDFGVAPSRSMRRLGK